MRAEFEAKEVFFVKIIGQKRETTSQTRDDKGLIKDFAAFLDEQKIVVLRVLIMGGGIFEGLFLKSDGEKILNWLKNNE